jgi:selenocysteine-specific elongation factor
LPEEKARGITIDLGFAQLALPGFSLGVIDVPGHEDFVRNMIAGIGSVNLVLLVVAADDGWMAQTEEHLQILDYLAVKHGVVAITKADLADAAQVAKEARTRLQGTSLADAPIVTTSVRDESSLQVLAETLATVCASVPPPRDIGRPRLFVDRAFSVRGAGTIVTGTLNGGRLRREEMVWLQPQNKEVRIRALQNHNQQVEMVLPGMRSALNLPDFQPNDIPRGSVIAGMSLPSSRTLDVLLRRSDRLGAEARPLKNLSSVQLHYGSARFSARATLLDRRELLPGENGIARLHFEEPIFAFLGDRFVLRDSSARRTIAGGIVLEGDAERIKFHSPGQRDLLTARAAAPNELEILVRTQLRRDRIIRSETLLLKSNFSRQEITNAVGVLVRTGELLQRGEFTADKASWETMMRAAAKAIDDRHAARPNELGLELPELRRILALANPHLFETLLIDLCERDFEHRGNAIRRRTHRLSLPKQLEGIAGEIRAALAARPFDPPSLKELAKTAPAREALRFLCANGEAVRINDEFVLSTTAFDEMKRRIVATLRTRDAGTASELRQALGTTRRVLVPLLEYLDRLGLTTRVGDRRTLRKL